MEQVHEVHVQRHVQRDIIVRHEVVVVQHVQIQNHQIHTIQVKHVVIVVDGHVMHDIIKIVVTHVQDVKHDIVVHETIQGMHVEDENGVQHEVQVVVI